MDAAPPPRPLLRLTICLLAGLAAVGLIWAATLTVGPRIGVAGDPPNYVQAAVHLARLSGFETCAIKPLVAYQILYPAGLAVAHQLGLSLIDSVRATSMLSFAVLVVATGLALRRVMSATTLYGLTLLSILAWPEMLAWQVKSLTDAPFSGTVMVFLWLITGFGRNGGRGWLIAAALAAGASTMVRYIGATTILIGLAAVFLAPAPITLRRRFGNLLWFGVIAGAPLTIYLIRNWLVSSTLTGPRPREATPFWDHLQLMADQLSAWFFYLPGLTPAVRTPLLAVILAGAALTALVLAVRSPRREADRLAMLCLSFVGLYLAAIATLRSVIQFDDVSGRFVLPVAVPTLVFLAVTLDRAAAVVGTGRRRAPVIAGLALIWLGWLYVPAKNLTALTLDAGPPDHDRTATREIRQSPFLQTARERRSAGTRLVALDVETANFLFTHLEVCLPVADLRPGHDRGMAPGDLVAEIYHPDLNAGPDQYLSRDVLSAAGLETVYSGRYGRLHQVGTWSASTAGTRP